MILPAPGQQQAAHATGRIAPKPKSDAPLYQQEWIWGVGAGVVWFFIFSAGMLLESLPHRVALGWSQEETRDDANIGRLTRQLVQLSNPPLLPNTSEAPAGQQVSSPPTAASTVALLTQAIEEQGSKVGGPRANQDAESQRAQGGDKDTATAWQTIYHFLASMLLYTPLNVALLALLAGLIGGCASNEADHSELLRDIEDKEKEADAAALRVLRRKLTYLEEHPAYSMMRSFIVYLVFISGLYIASSDPFNPFVPHPRFYPIHPPRRSRLRPRLHRWLRPDALSALARSGSLTREPAAARRGNRQNRHPQDRDRRKDRAHPAGRSTRT